MFLGTVTINIITLSRNINEHRTEETDQFPGYVFLDVHQNIIYRLLKVNSNFPSKPTYFMTI